MQEKKERRVGGKQSERERECERGREEEKSVCRARVEASDQPCAWHSPAARQVCVSPCTCRELGNMDGRVL